MTEPRCECGCIAEQHNPLSDDSECLNPRCPAQCRHYVPVGGRAKAIVQAQRAFDRFDTKTLGHALAVLIPGATVPTQDHATTRPLREE